MCETAVSSIPRPRWGLLYGATFPQLAALAVVEAASPPNAVRTALRCVLALGAFAGMAAWVRSNRAAFDLQDWCDCAGQKVTVRVIESRRAAPPALPPDPERPAPDWAEEEYEVACRRAAKRSRGQKTA